jgi:hypothetical protein
MGFRPAALSNLNAPGGRITDVSAGLQQMWEGLLRNGMGHFTNSCAVAR